MHETTNRERLSIGGAEGITLVVFHPDAGSTDADTDTLAPLASAAMPTADAAPELGNQP